MSNPRFDILPALTGRTEDPDLRRGVTVLALLAAGDMVGEAYVARLLNPDTKPEARDEIARWLDEAAARLFTRPSAPADQVRAGLDHIKRTYGTGAHPDPVAARQGAPEHDWNMPHEFRSTSDEVAGCPPNCPYRLWVAEHCYRCSIHCPDPYQGRSEPLSADGR